MTEEAEREHYEEARRELAQAKNLRSFPQMAQAHALTAGAHLQMAEYIRAKRLHDRG